MASDKPHSAAKQATAPNRAARSRTRNGSNHHSSAIAGSTTDATAATVQPSLGYTAIRNAMLSKSTIMMSRKFTVISRTPCLNCDSRISAAISASVSAAAAIGRRSGTKQCKIEKSPGQDERDPRHETDFRPKQDCRAPQDGGAQGSPRPSCGGRRNRRRARNGLKRRARAAFSRCRAGTGYATGREPTDIILQ